MTTHPPPTAGEITELRRHAEELRYASDEGKRTTGVGQRHGELLLALLDDYEKQVRFETVYAQATCDIVVEANNAMLKFPPFNSAHEGYAVLLEEVDELKAHVWMKQGSRDVAKMRKEGVQVAAMALRFVVDICDSDRGQK